MSHLLASRCTVCGQVDDPPCPECPGQNGSSHGTVDQKPWRHVAEDGYVHEWHPDCIEGSDCSLNCVPSQDAGA